MRIKTIIKWFNYCLMHTLNYRGYQMIAGTNTLKLNKNIRMAERALKELKKYDDTRGT